MDIPKKFTLVNRTWTVSLFNKEKMREMATKAGYSCDKNEVPWGRSDANSAEIWVRSDLNSDALQHTFLHELVHALLYTDGIVDEHDEGFVDRMGAYLHQYEQTKKGVH